MSQVWKVFRGMTFLTIAEIFSQAFGALATLYLARILEPDWFGKLNFARAFSSYFLILGIFGLDIAGIRAVATKKEEAPYIVGNLVPMFASMSIVASIVMLVLSFVIGGHNIDTKLIQLFVLSTLANAFTIEWLFQGFENQERVAISRIIQRLIYCIAILFISSPEQVYRVPIIAFIAILVGQGYLWIIFLSKSKLSFCISKEFIIATMKYALPIGLAGLSITIYHNTDSLMLGLIRTSSEVGYYNAGAKIVLLIALIRHLTMQSAFPRLNNLFVNEPEKFREVCLHLQLIVSSVAVPVLFTMANFSKQIIIFLYGDKYLLSADAMPYLLASIALLYSSFIFPNLLNVIGRSWGFFKVTLLAAIVNVIFNYIWIPQKGIIGAAMGTIVAEASILLLSFYLTKEITKFRFTALFSPIITGTLAMITISSFIENIPLKIISGIAVYCFFWLITYNFVKDNIIRKN